MPSRTGHIPKSGGGVRRRVNANRRIAWPVYLAPPPPPPVFLCFFSQSSVMSMLTELLHEIE